ncbi:DUF6660 family protein [Aquimarina mytili]|uniref:Uncharacterized protein n=1 Tax=Aquimarina mytili TaxID=874423 RepID=A0A936ZP23_9FLAO|nr:DUF6660 family protein [Aquimarina mytili]MBL0682113.1 hypothetical protein [Aquimarina mytili]
MKFLTVLFSLYFFALNFVPCEDAHTSMDDVQVEVCQNLDICDDHNGSDHCSPFCQCHCCHVHVINFDIVQFETQLAYIPTKIFSPNEGISEDIVDPILQPPQLIG